MSVTKSIRFPDALSLKIRDKAKDEYRSFSGAVLQLCDEALMRKECHQHQQEKEKEKEKEAKQ